MRAGHSFAEESVNILRSSSSIVPLPQVDYATEHHSSQERLSELKEVDDNKDENKANTKPARVNPFNAYAYADGIDKLLITCGMLASLGLGMMIPINMGVIGDGLASAGMDDYSGMDSMVRSLIILGSVGLVLGFVAAYCLELTAERQTATVKRKYISAILKQEVGFFDVKDVGTLAADVETSCVQIRDGMGYQTGQILRSLAMLIGGYVIALTKDWKMALLMTTAVPVIGLLIIFLFRTVGKAAEQSKQNYAAASSVAEEALPSARTVASYNLQDTFIKRFTEKIDASFKSEMVAAAVRSIAMGLIFCVIYLSYALGWWWGGRVIRDKVSEEGPEGARYAGNVITCFFCVLIGAFSLAGIGPSLTALTTAARAIISLREIIDRESVIDPTLETGRKLDDIKGDIEFKHVRFAYPSRPERDVYQDVSFKIAAGDEVALVGPSGAGKSTVIQLLERFYDPSEGEILVDGVNTKDLNLQWFREHISLVSQEPRLFCTTVYENIAMGRIGCTREEVEEAAKAANAHAFITNLADGYDTQVGAGGGLLSGGQKQRIAIARAIIRDPAILILDEATSALDNQSEKQVQEALDVLLKMKKRTTIVIAHRLTTIRNANKIIVVDNVEGRGSMVIEEGTHEELTRIENGVYRNLVEAQIAGKMPTPVSDVTEPLLSTNDPAIRQLSKRKSKDASVIEHDVDDKMLSRKGVDDEKLSKKGDRKAKEHTLSQLYALQLRHKRWFLTAIVVTLLNAFGQPANVLLISQFMNTFMTYDVDKTPKQNGDSLYDSSRNLALAYVGVAVAVGLGQFIASYCIDRSGAYLVSELRVALFGNMLHQDMEFFDAPDHGVGYLSSIMSADCETAKTVLGGNFQMVLLNTSALFIAMIMALCFAWKLGLPLTFCYLLALSAIFFQSIALRSAGKKRDDLQDRSSPAFVLNEIVTNLKTVAAYNLQPQFVTSFNQSLESKYAYGKRNCLICGVASSITDGVLFYVNAIAYRYGEHLMRYEGLDFLNLMRTVVALSSTSNGLSRVAGSIANVKMASKACVRIFATLRRQPKIDARNQSGYTIETTGSAAVSHVKFRYSGRPNVPVLADVDFKVPAGKITALVGESGSGKSTIIQFLERFYDVEASEHFAQTVRNHNEAAELLGEGGSYKRMESASQMFSGQVSLEEYNVQDLRVTFLRDQMGLVGQEPVLFDLTVAENIRYGKPDATMLEIESAARAANAHEFIMNLPEGYETCVGKGGSLLSGGQKQRVAIARAIVRDPQILLLDEATSALDPESEKVVQRALDELVRERKRTTIVIAHRLSTIKNADQIVVFKPEPGVGSRIVEVGTHEELYNIPNGIYRNLVLIAEGAAAHSHT